MLNTAPGTTVRRIPSQERILCSTLSWGTSFSRECYGRRRLLPRETAARGGTQTCLHARSLEPRFTQLPCTTSASNMLVDYGGGYTPHANVQLAHRAMHASLGSKSHRWIRISWRLCAERELNKPTTGRQGNCDSAFTAKKACSMHPDRQHVEAAYR